MVCKGICSRYKAWVTPSLGIYKKGHKRCKTCEIFIACEGRFCPCCGILLRTKPRNRIYKEKLRAAKEKTV